MRAADDPFWGKSFHIEIPKHERSRVLACVSLSGFTHRGTVLLGLQVDQVLWPLAVRHLPHNYPKVSFGLCGYHFLRPKQIEALTGGCILSRAGLCIGKDTAAMLVAAGLSGPQVRTDLTWL